MYVNLGVTSEARELERDHCWGLGGGDSRTPVTGRHRGGAVGTNMGVAEEERLRVLVKN